MSDYDYKTVAAPRRAKKVKGIKGRDALLAHAVGEAIQIEAAEGWEYVRTDRFPVEESGGLFSKTATVDRAVMIFRKRVAASRPAPAPQAAAQPAPQPQPQPEAAPKSDSAPAFSIAGVEPAKSPPLGSAKDD